MPVWVEHAIFWHVYPLGFVGAEIRPERPASLAHRLGRLTGWLDYAIELGASGLLLGPIFAAASHGYDTIDHFRIDPRLGDDADFDALIEAARRRGLNVVLDGVFNHVSRRHPAFRGARRQRPHRPPAPPGSVSRAVRSTGTRPRPSRATMTSSSSTTTRRRSKTSSPTS